MALFRQELFVSDDYDARAAANQNGIALTGTLGVLLLCIRRQHLTLAEGTASLRKPLDTGFHSPVESLDSLLGNQSS